MSAEQKQQELFMAAQQSRIAQQSRGAPTGGGSHALNAFLAGSGPGGGRGKMVGRPREPVDRPKYSVPSAIFKAQSRDAALGLAENPDGSSKDDDEKESDAPPKKEEKPKPKGPLRSTANCSGRVVYSRGGSSSNAAHNMGDFSPNERMQVTWQHHVETAGRQAYPPRLAIALQRYGSATNTQSIVAKRCRNNETRGSIQFTAPKSAGMFVYRLFDDSTPETSVETLASSAPFQVYLAGNHLQNSLQIAAESLEKSGSESVGLAQLKSTLDGFGRDSALSVGSYQWQSVSALLRTCLRAVLRMVGSASEDMGHEPPVCGLGEEMSDKDKVLANKFRKASRTHLDAFDVLKAVLRNRVACGLVPDQLLEHVQQRAALFSDVSYRMYDSQKTLDEAMLQKLSFVPAPLKLDNQPSDDSMVSELQQSINELLLSIMPDSATFDEEREAVRARLETMLLETGAIPAKARLVLFGSSRNSFGSIGADMDMSLQLEEKWVELASDVKERLIVKVTEALTTASMDSVESRATARVPIVMFVDPSTGLHCDISCGNPLAIRNTRMLRAYGSVDPRVRELAFVIKYWAKRRQINSPQFSTLSSYGYLLCVIHFLQTRSPPVVPNLQNLSHEWRYTDNHAGYDEMLLKGLRTKEMEAHRMNIGTRPAIFPYFYDPETQGTVHLNTFASQNKQTTAELLVEFFAYFAWQFDYRSSVVSISAMGKTFTPIPGMDPRIPVATVPKLVKIETDCWPPSSKLSIEDPFETWYDVGHVIRGPQMTTTRKEFIRAHTLFARCFEPSDTDDSLPGCVDASDLLAIMCEEMEEPVRKERANTIVSESGNDAGA